ncbi:MAG TPA: LPS assembly protein LptD [Candidatus Binatia bacterium]
MILKKTFLVLGIAVAMAAEGRSAQLTAPRTQGGTGEINVTADKLSTSDGSNQIEATGSVELKRDLTTLRADEVRVNRSTQDVEANGNVTVDDPEWRVKSADSLQLNMEQETGEIQNGDIFLENGHVSMSGRRLQKLGGQSYHFEDGFFTTCLCESGAPSWKFFAEQMNLDLEGVGTVKNAYFYIFDVPVLYVPYGIFPIKAERQTGFLFPQVGQSNKDGFRYLQPFYWAMSKSTDSTVSFDLETRARYGFLGEFRTKIDRDSDFRIDGSYFNEIWRKNADADVVDKTIANPHIPQNRWNIISSHRYLTGNDWLTFSDIAGYSDTLFTRELVDRFDLRGSIESDIRRSRFGKSNFGVFRNWGDTFLRADYAFYQDFIQNQSTTMQRTPEVNFWGRRLLPNFPLEFRWRAQGINYWRIEGVNDSRPQTGDGLRFDLRPEMVLPFRLGSRFFGSASVAPRATLYHLYSPPPAGSSDHNVSRELVELRWNVGTAVSRVFAFNALGLSRIKHVLEPEISYLFIPGVNQSNIPIMDEIDRINRRNVFTFALTNRFWGKAISGLAPPPEDSSVESLSPFVGNIRQMASVRLAMSYDISAARTGSNDSLTDLDINMRLLPVPYLTVAFDGGINPNSGNISQARLAFTVSDPRPILHRSLDPDFTRPNSASIGYQFLRNGPNSFLADNANINLDAPADCTRNPTDPRCPLDNPQGNTKNTVGNFNASALYRITDHLLLNFSSTYDVLDNKFIGFRATTKFLSFCECWTATLGVSHNVNPAKTSFSFNFSLLGLGNTKSSL